MTICLHKRSTQWGGGLEVLMSAAVAHFIVELIPRPLVWNCSTSYLDKIELQIEANEGVLGSLTTLYFLKRTAPCISPPVTVVTSVAVRHLS